MISIFGRATLSDVESSRKLEDSCLLVAGGRVREGEEVEMSRLRGCNGAIDDLQLISQYGKYFKVNLLPALLIWKRLILLEGVVPGVFDDGLSEDVSNLFAVQLEYGKWCAGECWCFRILTASFARMSVVVVIE